MTQLAWYAIVASVITSAIVTILMDILLFRLTRKTISKEIEKLTRIRDLLPHETCPHGYTMGEVCAVCGGFGRRFEYRK